MKPHITSLINGILLVTLPFWAYFTAENPSMTFLIPVFFGVILLLLNKGIKNENKVIAHVGVALTLLIFVALIMPLRGAMNRGDNLGIMRVSILLLSTLVALISFVKSFIDARRKK